MKMFKSKTTQSQMCMTFLGQPKAPKELETVDMNNL
ncbi:MAG: cyclic lactone autoinducer peptide [Lachnospiraceae bacterium]|nr:cyclic lactone autoinducer peptide [Lachnospiraceae bacterium]